MNLKKELGLKIKQLRKNKKLTQEQLSEIININPRNLAAIESGSNFLKAETIEKLIIALDTTAEELFSNDYLKELPKLKAQITNDIKTIENDEKKLRAVYKFISCIKSL